MQFNWFRKTKVSQRPDNPYVTGNAVGGSPAFIGRDDVLRKVENTLSHVHQNAITLFGQRRIGKTSVLKELDARLLKKVNYQPIYFDLQGQVNKSLEAVLNELADTICQKLKQTKPQWNDTKTQFHDWLAELLLERENELSEESSESEKELPETDPLSGKSLVLLFDEFEAINDTNTERMRDDFFNYLNKLLSINTKRLNMVFAIGRNIDDLEEVAWSLFKTMNNYRVSLLEKEETEKLIRLSEHKKSLYWSGKAVKKIWELTHGHPYLIQLLCSSIWQQLWDQNPTKVPSVTLGIVEENIRRISQQRLEQNPLTWLWDGLPAACKIDTAALAGIGKKSISQKELIKHLYDSGVGTVIDELETAPKNLKDWDIIEGDAQKGYFFRVELFRQWVVEHKPLKEILREELGRIRVKAEQYYQEGKSCYQNQQFDEAIDKLDSAIRINFQFLEARQLKAKILVEQGKIAEAQTALEKFYQYYPDAARPQLTELLWQQVESSNSRKEQLTLCEQILQYDSTHSNAKKKRTEILQWQGQRFEEDEDYEKAIEAYRKAGSEDKVKVRELQWKVFWNKYSKMIIFLSVLIGVFLLSFVMSFFEKEMTLSVNLSIPWWVLGTTLGIILGSVVFLIDKIPFIKKRKIKRF
jgi:tetratricopeptide (TPR) repeat protein